MAYPHSRGLYVAVVLSLGVAGPIATAFADDEQSGTLSEIVVTARRYEELLQDVPASISVLNERQLEDRNINDAANLAVYTPSLSANIAFGEDNASFSLRGFQQDIGTSPTVGVYFADVVRPRGGFGGSTEHGGEGAGPGLFFDLENVQVLKGPQGTLFGRNTTGGAILLVPKMPTDKFEGYAEVSGGNFGMEETQAVLNVPVSDRIRIRMGFDQKKRDGYLENTSGIGPSAFEDINYRAARFAVDVTVTDAIDNYTIATYSQSDTAGVGAKLVACEPNSPAPGAILLTQFACPQVQREAGSDYYDIANDDPIAHSYVRDSQVINRTTWQIDDKFTLKNIASYSRHYAELASSLFGTDWFIPSALTFGAFAIPTGALAGTHLNFTSSDMPPGMPQSYEQATTEELQIHGVSLQGKLDWQAGLYFEYNFPKGLSGTSSGTLLNCTSIALLQCTDPLSAILGSTGNASRRFGTLSWRDYAAYSQGTYSITDWLKAEAGVRYTYDLQFDDITRQLFYFGAVPGVGPLSMECEPPNPNANCLVADRQTSHAPTWVLNLEATPWDGINTYAQYARGYRQGGIMATGPIGLQKYGPEHVNTYEVGVKSTFKGVIPGFVNVAVFYNDLTDVQVQGSLVNRSFGIPLNAAIQNAGAAKIWGFEFEAAVKPITRVTVNAAYTYLHSRLEQANSIFFPTGPYEEFVPTGSVGGPLAFTPQNKFTIEVNYALPVEDTLGKITLGTNYTYTSSIIYQAGPLGATPAYGLLNANINWQSVLQKPVDLEFFMTNALDRHYSQFNDDFYVAAGFSIETPGEPRMFGARARVHF